MDVPISPVPLDLPAPAGLRTLLVLGGSFDPVHRGHVDLPLLARQHLERQHGAPGSVHLLFVPAARSPHKAARPTPDAHRLAMLNLATQHLPRAGVWTDELDRARHAPDTPSYTIDTVGRLRNWLVEHELGQLSVRLLIGADQARAFHLWKDAPELLRLAEPVVMLRGTDRQALLQALAPHWPPDELARWGARIASVGQLDVSSSALRAALAQGAQAQGGPGPHLERLLDPQVLSYIQRHRLYEDTGGPRTPEGVGS
jgi:nicotinate-nucleotide adenylyltransferase